ncbi:lia operon protein LiaI [Amphibacillus marinus]|uniref:Lia operon protein LiaI n=1 Tax=Amphibacillus marinus TaxID=872970 RepID=A0A1H8LCX4_9BACI|nr:hypothetical protein [Amphibacillus marinus]SEO02991.1 lia operon protein LiaI [Amphibacillus marinus]
MRTFLFVIAAFFLGLIVLSTLGPLISLIITVALGYYGARKCILAETTGAKIGWAIVALIGISMSFSNAPAIVGGVALVLLYFAYRKYKRAERIKDHENWIID